MFTTITDRTELVLCGQLTGLTERHRETCCVQVTWNVRSVRAPELLSVNTGIFSRPLLKSTTRVSSFILEVKSIHWSSYQRQKCCEKLKPRSCDFRCFDWRRAPPGGDVASLHQCNYKAFGLTIWPQWGQSGQRLIKDKYSTAWDNCSI